MAWGKGYVFLFTPDLGNLLEEVEPELLEPAGHLLPAAVSTGRQEVSCSATRLHPLPWGTGHKAITAAHLFSNPHGFTRMRSKINLGGYSSNVFLDLEKATACYRLPAGLPSVKATKRAAARISISELFTEFCPSLRHFPSQY